MGEPDLIHAGLCKESLIQRPMSQPVPMSDDACNDKLGTSPQTASDLEVVMTMREHLPSEVAALPQEQQDAYLLSLVQRLRHKEKSDHGEQMTLRFGIADRVYCNTAEGWQLGSVVELYYREDDWPDGQVAAYQVELDAGCLVYVPQDSEQFIITGKRHKPWHIQDEQAMR